MPHSDPLRKMFTVTGCTAKCSLFQHSSKPKDITMPNQYAATSNKKKKKKKSSSNQVFPIENTNFPKLNYISWKYSATLIRTGQAFQVALSSSCGISPTIHQEFKKTSQVEDAFRIFLHLLESICGQLGVSLGCTAPDSTLLVNAHYAFVRQAEKLTAWHNMWYHSLYRWLL